MILCKYNINLQNLLHHDLHRLKNPYNTLPHLRHHDHEMWITNTWTALPTYYHATVRMNRWSWHSCISNLQTCRTYQVSLQTSEVYVWSCRSCLFWFYTVLVSQSKMQTLQKRTKYARNISIVSWSGKAQGWMARRYCNVWMHTQTFLKNVCPSGCHMEDMVPRHEGHNTIKV